VYNDDGERERLLLKNLKELLGIYWLERAKQSHKDQDLVDF
jgi:hypothetical protein